MTQEKNAELAMELFSREKKVQSWAGFSVDHVFGGPADLVHCFGSPYEPSGWKTGTIKPNLRKIRDSAIRYVFLEIEIEKVSGRDQPSLHPREYWIDHVSKVFPIPTWKCEFSTVGNRFRVIISKSFDHRQHIESLQIFQPIDLEGPKIAIIGNGPINETDSKSIKEADFVIRFNDWNRRRGYDKAVMGDQCDLLFTQFDSDHSQRKLPHNPKTVVIAIPSPFHQDRVIEKAGEWYSNSKIRMFNPYVMRILCRDVLRLRDSDGSRHPIPTVGFQMLWQLHRWMLFNEIWIRRIFVSGFTWHVDQKTGLVNNCELSGDDFPNHYNHSYLREVKWCVQNLLHCPAFQFGERSKASLEFVEQNQNKREKQ